MNILDNRPEDSDFGLFVSDWSIEAQKIRVRTNGILTRKTFEMRARLTPEARVMSFFRDNYLLGTPHTSLVILGDGLHASAYWTAM